MTREITNTPGAVTAEETAALRQQVDLVYAYALRQTRDKDIAADVTQAVFVVLARKKNAGRGPPEKFVQGWLFKVTSYAVKEARRAAARRAHHERQAAMATPETVMLSETEKAELVATVDASMLRLSAIDREVIVRRYLQGQPLVEVAAAVGMTENTAGRRVTRALEKLRKMVAGNGSRASASVIAAVAAEQALVHAPPSAIAGVISASAAPHVTVLSNAVLSGMLAMKMLKIGIVTVTVVVVSGGAWIELRSWAAAAAAQSQPVEPAAPELVITAVLEENSDTLLQNELALIEKDRVKIKTLDVESKVQKSQWDPVQKRLVDNFIIEGHALMEAGAPQRSRMEVSRTRDGTGMQDGKAVVPKEESFVQVWDGQKTRVLLGPPLSAPAATINWDWQASQDLLVGSEFSLQLMHDPSVYHNQVPGPHPMARESFTGYEVKARRVMLQGEREAVEITMYPPRLDRVQRVFWLDPRRGHVLMGMRQTYTAPEVPRTEVVVVDTFAEAAPGIFVPKTAHSWTWDPKLGVVTSRTQYEVKTVTANKAIPATTFDLAFPAGIPVREIGKPATQPATSRPALKLAP